MSVIASATIAAPAPSTPAAPVQAPTGLSTAALTPGIRVEFRTASSNSCCNACRRGGGSAASDGSGNGNPSTVSTGPSPTGSFDGDTDRVGARPADRRSGPVTGPPGEPLVQPDNAATATTNPIHRPATTFRIAITSVRPSR